MVNMPIWVGFKRLKESAINLREGGISLYTKLTEKNILIALIGLSILFIYLLSHFIFIVFKIDATVEELQGKQVSAKDTKHIVLIVQEHSNPYWKEIEEGARAASKKEHFELEYTGPIRSDINEQTKLLEKSIAAKVDGIIVQSLDNQVFTPLIDKAIRQGIPVITIDADAYSSQRLTYVGTDNFEAGKQLGIKVVEETNGKGTIGVIVGDLTAENQKLRVNGLKSVVEQHPEMKLIEVLSSNISRVRAVQQAQKILQEHPEVDIMVGTSVYDAVGILKASTSLNREVEIFSFDALDETIAAIKDGNINATIVQNPYQMGANSVNLLKYYFMGKVLPKNSFTKTVIIDHENVKME